MLKVVAFMKQVAEELRMGGNFGTAHGYRSSTNALIAYWGEGDISFDDIKKSLEEVLNKNEPILYILNHL